ncbi:serine hydrolase domain-containing protein [Nitratireductor thuwali]|uniref:6-aminohexanoate-dimer hydrolase n=1 Tax=Nitratireductor thuwali TaxID=2267699 RepID=A0ABY5MLY5_9HYPH|nr:6-aminohexanoate-dimer hydrolase [Nitratireductor thuwali]
MNIEAHWQDRREVTLGNWRTAPYSRWSFQHVGEIVPSAVIGGPSGGAYAAGPALPDFMLHYPGGGRVGLFDHLARSHGDSMVVMREGAVVGEWHAAHADPALPHVIFSVSKSLTGMLAGVAVGDGVLDPQAPVAAYVDTPGGSAYAGARVRDLLDMTVDLDFDEEYLDDGGAFDRYRRAMLWNPEREDTHPETMEAFLAGLGTRAGRHGERFYYASPNTDMLGLVIERASGLRLHHYLGERIWKPMGAKDAAIVTVDRQGTARAAGGICVSPRDLALFGQLVLDGGRSRGGEQLIPADWIADMREAGDRKAWEQGNFFETFPEGTYRSCWYQARDDHGSFCGIGIHGQYVWADPLTGIVVAKTSSRPQPSEDAAVQLEISVLRQIAGMF